MVMLLRTDNLLKSELDSLYSKTHTNLYQLNTIKLKGNINYSFSFCFRQMVVKYYSQLTIHTKQQLFNKLSRISLTNAKNLETVQQAAHMLSLSLTTHVWLYTRSTAQASTE